MSARNLRRPVSIVLEIDPALVPRVPTLGGNAPARIYSVPAYWRLRLIPCRGGVRLHTPGGQCGPDAPPIHATPDDLAAELGDRALDASLRAGECTPGTATHTYREDRMWFYLLAVRAVHHDPRIRRLWGLE